MPQFSETTTQTCLLQTDNVCLWRGGKGTGIFLLNIETVKVSEERERLAALLGPLNVKDVYYELSSVLFKVLRVCDYKYGENVN